MPVDNPASLTSVEPTCPREPVRVTALATDRRWPVGALASLSARGCMAPINRRPDATQKAPNRASGLAVAAVIARPQNDPDKEAVTTKLTA